jgi:hypothetical protein
VCRFRQCGKNIGLFVPQQRCSRVPGSTCRKAAQNRRAPSPTANTGAVIPRRQQSLRRSAHDSGALAVPVGECDQFVSAVIVAPDHLLLQPHLQMDAVHP